LHSETNGAVLDSLAYPPHGYTREREEDSPFNDALWIRQQPTADMDQRRPTTADDSKRLTQY
jgi:hypothetical protein